METNGNGDRVDPADSLTARINRRAVLARGLALSLSAPVISALLAACGGDSGGNATNTSGTGGAATSTIGGATTATSGAGGATAPAGAGGGASPTVGGLASATTGGAGSGAPAGRLIIGRNIDDIITFDPGLAYEFSVFPTFWAAYQAMLLPDPQDLTTFLPVLCQQTPSTANGGISADGLTYTFKLKQGVMFSTGKEMKAEDWVFCGKRLWYLKKNPSFLAEPFSNDAGVNVRAVDDYTVEYTLNAPNVAFLAYMSSITGIVYDSAAAKTNGALDTPAAETGDTAQAWFDQNTAGVGPYQLTSFKPREEIVLEPFADSYAGAPAYQQIIFRHIADSASQLQQLEGGEIDFAWGLDPDAIGQLRGNANMQVVEQPGLVINYLGMHNDPAVGGILADVRVRQAIAYSIDYDGIVNNLRAGAAVRPASTAAIGMLGADKVQNLAYTRDLNKAKALLQEAGATGKEWTLTYRASGGDEVLATKLQSDIQESGLKVTLNPMDTTQLLEDYRAAKLQAVVLEWGPDYLDVHTNTYPFGGVPNIAPAKRVGYVNAQNEALLANAIKETDKTKREALYVQVETNIINDAAFVVLFQPVSQYGAKKNVSGITIHPGWFFLLDRFSSA